LNIPRLSVERPVAITMIIGIIIVLGLFSLYNLSLELLPDFSYPVISIMTTWKGAAPEDVERMLTEPIEELMASISKVKSVKSISREGVSVVMVEFEWGANLDFSAQDIRNQISLYKGFLPSDVSDPLVFKFDVSMIPVGSFAIIGEENPEKQRRIAEDFIKHRLQRLDGVASVSLFGGRKNEIRIELDRTRLEALGINAQQIIMALAFNNVNLPAGYLTRQNKEYLLRTYGEYKSIEDIKNVIVGLTKDYKPIHLREIANVRKGFKDVRGVAKIDEEDAIWLMIMKESGANTVRVMSKVLKEIEVLGKILPPNIKIVSLFDMSKIIKKVTYRTSSNAIIGAILAVIMIFVFLRTWRPTLAISLAIPFSVIATFIPIYFSGYTLNIMTLGGLALGVGMLVDNAIVVIENIYRKIEEGETRKVAASEGASQVGMAITASTLTTIAVFFPMMLIPGITGELSRGLALPITFSLLASLFVAMTLVPVIAAQIFKKKHKRSMEVTGWFRSIIDRYSIFLRWVIKHKGLTILLAFILFGISLGLLPFIGGEFLPKMEQEFGQALFYMPPGSPMEQTKKVAEDLIQDVKDDPDVIHYGYTVGSTEGTGSDIAFGSTTGETNEGAIFLVFEEREKRTHSTSVPMNKMRENFPVLSNSRFIVQDMSQMSFGGSDNPIDVKIYGTDFKKLNELANIISDEMNSNQNLTDVDISYKKGKPEFRILVDREKASRFGLNISEVANVIRTYSIGSLAGRYNDDGKLIDIIVLLKPEERSKMADILNLPIVNSAGLVVPLSQVSHIEETTGPIQIDRDEKQRKVSVTASVAEGGKLNKEVGKIQKYLKNLSKQEEVWPEDYSYHIGGAAEEYKDMINAFLIAILAAILLVYMVMAAQFESFLHPLVIMFTQPMAAIGVFWALFITGKTLSMPSFMGIMILAGIVVNNGIVFIDFINQLRRKGMDRDKAIERAGVVRFRPIIITALTTILGMLPMAIFATEGSEMRAPMAVAAIGGLISATVLTLLVLPAGYIVADNISKKLTKRVKTIIGTHED